MTLTSSAGRTAVRATGDRQARNSAEAGVNAAMSALDAQSANSLDPSLLPPPPDPGARRIDPGTGYVLRGGPLDTTTSQWHITSVGYAPNSSGPSLPTKKNGDPLWARTVNSTAPTITPPVPDWTSWYSSATLGPHAPCFPATAVDPPVFDDDGVLELATNGSAGTLDLTPTTSYTWQTVYGELSWNAATRELTVKGVIYFDGSTVVSNGAVDEYNGQATLYLTGTFTMINNSMMCGKRTADGSDCDFDAGTDWNPNTEMLIVAAHGKHASGDSVALENNTRWEGGIYAQDNLALVNDAKVEGPDDPRRLHGHEQRLRGAVPGDRHGAARRPGEPERLRRRADARDIG